MSGADAFHAQVENRLCMSIADRMRGSDFLHPTIGSPKSRFDLGILVEGFRLCSSMS